MNAQLMLPNNTYKNKTVLITGGGTGLGKSMAIAYSYLGARVIIMSRKLEVLKESADEIMSITGNKVIPISCDVRDQNKVKESLIDFTSTNGSINILINNAAGNFISPTEKLSINAFNAIIDIVLKGTFNVTHALANYWIENKLTANVLNIVTTYAWTGSGYVVPSACAKAGVLAMTRSLCVEWAKHNIRMNAIAPGSFPTKGAWSRLFPKELSQLMDPKKRIPLNRFGEHYELANLATYLTSDFASFVNGEVVTIDGGEWLKGAGQFNSLEIINDQMWDMIDDARKER